MGYDDPLANWLAWKHVCQESGISATVLATRQAEASKSLDQLEAFLDDPDHKRTDMAYATCLSHWFGGVLAPNDVARAEQLYRRVYATRGLGSRHVQEALLYPLAMAHDAGAVPFWLDVLALSRPREQGAPQRREMAVAALAFLIIEGDAPAASEALRALAQHTQPEVRGLAVHYWSRAYRDAERALPSDVLAVVSHMAAQDAGFAPRFLARAALRDAEQPIPFDNPGGAYAFKVRLDGISSLYRTIELRSEQTLDDLHRAIQNAFRWDADHLYSFFMNGRQGDERYRFACPSEDDGPYWADEVALGELGLTLKHRFLYYFDYGDSHQFEVQVVGILPQAEASGYPRVVDGRGAAPSQYGYGEDEEVEAWDTDGSDIEEER